MVPHCRVQGPRRETGETSGSGGTWGMVYLVNLVCLVCLVGRIGKPIRGTRETGQQTDAPVSRRAASSPKQPGEFSAQVPE